MYQLMVALGFEYTTHSILTLVAPSAVPNGSAGNEAISGATIFYIEKNKKIKIESFFRNYTLLIM